MKTPSDELFNLIKSLNSEEKRQFKLFSANTAENYTYLKLFDLIDKQKRYDESKLIAIVSEKSYQSQFKHIKSYLQETIYKFIEYYYSDYSVEIQIQRLLQRVEISCAKRLFSAAKKQLEKAEKIAIDNYQYLHVISILSWKRRLNINSVTIINFKVYEREQYNSQLHYLSLYYNILEYQKIEIHVKNILIASPENLNKKDIMELNKISTNPFLMNENRALSPKAKAYYYSILGETNLLLKNWKKCYVYFKKLVDYLDYAKLELEKRMSAFARLSVALYRLNRFEELKLLKMDIVNFYHSLSKKRQVPLLYNQYLSIMSNYVVYHMSVFNINEALLTCEEIEVDLGKLASKQTYLVFYFNKAVLFMFKLDFRNALYCLNKIVSVKKSTIRADIIADAKILYLVIHFELGNESMLPNLCKSAIRYFDKQKKHSYLIERILIDFFYKSIHKAQSKKDKAPLFKNLKTQLECYKSEKILERFDFISWAESKIQNRPMIEILKEKK